MRFSTIFNFYSTSILIVLGLVFINCRTIYICEKESKFTTISISMCKIFIMFFIISLNYKLFYNKIDSISIILHICKILSFLVLLLYFCKVIIFKHLIIYDNDILLKKYIDKLYIESNKIIIKTNTKTVHIDIDDKVNKKLLKNSYCK